MILIYLPMNDIQEITSALVKFRDDRDWGQFHNPKDLAAALSIEASELQELFLWKDANDGDVEKVREELADVLVFGFLLAEKYKFDIKEIMLEKIAKNAEKYPVEKSRGTAIKYNKL